MGDLLRDTLTLARTTTSYVSCLNLKNVIWNWVGKRRNTYVTLKMHKPNKTHAKKSSDGYNKKKTKCISGQISSKLSGKHKKDSE